MDSLFFHPKVVHVPMGLAVVMPLVAIALTLAWWRNWLPARGFAVAVVLQAVLVVSAFVALQTGEAQEEVVEKVVPERFIEGHEAGAKRFFLASAGVLVVMIAGFATRNRRAGLPLAAVATLGTVVVLGLGYQVGNGGGALVYRHGAAGAYVDAPARGPAAAVEHGEDGEHGESD